MEFLKFFLQLLVILLLQFFWGCVQNVCGKARVSHDTLVNKAWQACQNSDWKRAEKLFSNLVELYPESPQGYFGLGVVRAEQYDFHAAIALFEKTVNLAPLYDAAYANMGRMYLEQDPPEPEIAISLIQHAIDINPQNGENYFAKAVYYAFLEDYPRLWECVQNAQEKGYVVPQSFIQKAVVGERKSQAELRGQELRGIKGTDPNAD